MEEVLASQKIDISHGYTDSLQQLENLAWVPPISLDHWRDISTPFL